MISQIKQALNNARKELEESYDHGFQYDPDKRISIKHDGWCDVQAKIILMENEVEERIKGMSIAFLLNEYTDESTKNRLRRLSGAPDSATVVGMLQIIEQKRG